MSTVIRQRTGLCLIIVIAALACGSSAQARPVLAAPGELEVTARSETSLSLRWKDRSRSEAYYKVQVAGRVKRLAANRQTIIVTGLRPNVAYRFAVQACSRADRCSKAATGMATTVGARPALAPPASPPGPGTATDPTPSGSPPLPVSPPAPASPPASTTTVEVTGRVLVTTGNCMPSIGGPNQINPCQTNPVAGARVLLYSPVLRHDTEWPWGLHTDLRTPSAETTTDAAGRYHLVVAPGTYSFLADIGSGPECGWSDGNWSACPHALLSPTQTIDVKLDHAVW